MNDNVSATDKSPLKIVVMVVDDEEMVTTTLATYLELETDYDVLTFQSPLEALEQLKKKTVDLIISDFLMPDMDGLVFLREVKKLHPEITTILLTGYADKENAIKGINEVGLYQYIEKPWDNDHLKLVIRNGITTRNLRELLQKKIKEMDNLLLERDKLAQENKMLQEELALARNVQESLLPKEFPSSKGISIFGKYLPALQVGGDFYDCVTMSENRFAVLIADVTGHGIQAALITTLIKTAFSFFKDKEATPGEVLKYMNNWMYKILPTNLFVAGMVVVVDTEKSECYLANAGVPHPHVLRNGDNKVERIPLNGLLLGIADETLFMPPDEISVKLNAGDRLILYTDGISEAENEKEEFFEEKIIDTLKNNGGKKGDDAVEHLILAAQDFAVSDYNWDDITVVTIEKFT
jgi:serine phosphatase RsbU (regulator of sigma subunit)